MTCVYAFLLFKLNSNVVSSNVGKSSMNRLGVSDYYNPIKSSHVHLRMLGKFSGQWKPGTSVGARSIMGSFMHTRICICFMHPQTIP